LEIIRKTSVDAGIFLREQPDFENLDAVYIDSVHDGSHMAQDIISWLPLIKDEGVICGHDYIRVYTDMLDVLDYIFEEDIRMWILDKSKSRRAYKNVAQGGNWWVWLSEERKKKYLRRASKVLMDYSEGV
jgi:hypothetical protein